MLPLCDLVPTRTRPVATLLLVAAGAIGSVVLWAGQAGGAAPAWPALTPAGWSWLGLSAAQTMHATVTMAIVNLIALWLYGPVLEDRLGRGRFFAVWTISGLAAAAAHLAVAPHSGLLLLSGVGATAGLVAGNVALHPRGRFLAVTPVFIGFEFVDLPAWLYACVWLSVLPLASPVSLRALVLGLFVSGLVGAAGARLLSQPSRMRTDWWIGGVGTN